MSELVSWHIPSDEHASTSLRKITRSIKLFKFFRDRGGRHQVNIRACDPWEGLVMWRVSCFDARGVGGGVGDVDCQVL